MYVICLNVKYVICLNVKTKPNPICILLVFSGIVIDLMDAFHPGMYLSGILTILGGLVMILIPVFKKSPSSVVVEVDL